MFEKLQLPVGEEDVSGLKLHKPVEPIPDHDWKARPTMCTLSRTILTLKNISNLILSTVMKN
jgi:hypothetical protein